MEFTQGKYLSIDSKCARPGIGIVNIFGVDVGNIAKEFEKSVSKGVFNTLMD